MTDPVDQQAASKVPAMFMGWDIIGNIKGADRRWTAFGPHHCEDYPETFSADTFAELRTLIRAYTKETRCNCKDAFGKRPRADCPYCNGTSYLIAPECIMPGCETRTPNSICGACDEAVKREVEALSAPAQAASGAVGEERLRAALKNARSGFEAVQVLLSALSGRGSTMVETFIERIDEALSPKPTPGESRPDSALDQANRIAARMGGKFVPRDLDAPEDRSPADKPEGGV